MTPCTKKMSQNLQEWVSKVRYIALADRKKDWASGISVSDKPQPARPFMLFRIKAHGKEVQYSNYDHAHLRKGDKFEIIGVETNMADPSDLVVNLKGYVSNPMNNTGEDRGYVIDTGKDLLRRYSLNRQGRAFQIVVTRDDRILGKLFIDLSERGKEDSQ